MEGTYRVRSPEAPYGLLQRFHFTCGVAELPVGTFSAIPLIAVCAPALLAQINGTGTIQGTVTDPSGVVVGGAQVTPTSCVDREPILRT